MLNRGQFRFVLVTGLLAAAAFAGVACGSEPAGVVAQPTQPVAEAEVMAKKEGDAMMAKEGDAMMTKEGDAMMAKEGDAMTTKEGDAMMAKEGDAMTAKEGGALMAKLPDRIVAPHFVDSVPNHGDVLPRAPNAITLNFNFNLHADSSLAVTRDGQPVAIGPKAIAANQLSIAAPVTDPISADGIYTVNYKACWPDRSCHEGSVSFVVDSAKRSSFIDLRGRSEVAVALRNVAFDPPKIIVSPGTRVVWTNQDGFAHFVNSDPHPSHNGFPALNSSALEKGQSYSFTFSVPGIYGYHCSAHTNMTAQVLVEG